MGRCDVAIATRKPRTYYILIGLLRKLHLRFCSCAPGELPCKTAKVVVTTQSESPEIKRKSLVIVNDLPHRIRTELAIMIQYLDIKEVQKVIIGLDPGLRSGLAVLINGKVILTRTLVSPIKSIHFVKQLESIIIEMYPAASSLLRIGEGSRLYLVLFLRSIQRQEIEIPLEVVDERYTTIPQGYQTNESSAVLIAMRKGRKKRKSDVKIDCKPGYVRTLRQMFKRISDDQAELGIDEAKAILKGEIDLEDIL